MSDLSYYSPGRARQLTVLLWSAIVLAGLGAGLAGFLVGTGYPAYSVLVATPAFLVLGASAMALRALQAGTFAAKPWSASAGAVLILTGVLLADDAITILPSIVGILLVLLAMLADHGER